MRAVRQFVVMSEDGAVALVNGARTVQCPPGIRLIPGVTVAAVIYDNRDHPVAVGPAGSGWAETYLAAVTAAS